MGSKKLLIIGLVSATVVAGGLRFYRIGDWSFESDEIAALIEHDILFYDNVSADDEESNQQYSRLPKMLPLGYVIQHLDYSLFGRDEAGSRILPAIIGTLTVALTFLLLKPISGCATALATSLLLAFWQTHIYYSQMNRFYAISMMFSYLSLLVGAYELKKSRPWIPPIACVFSVAAAFSHAMAGVAFFLVCFGLLVECVVGRRRISRVNIYIYFGCAVFLASLLLFYFYPLSKGWNEGIMWGDSPLGAVAAAISRIGWPIVILSAVGAIMAAFGGGSHKWYWIACFLCFWIIVLASPLKLSFFTARYVLPISLAVFVLAGKAIADIYAMLRLKNNIIAVAWFAAALALSAPSLISHYVDGSRADIRSAIRHIERNWREGDVLFKAEGGKIIFDYYAPACTPCYSSTKDPLARLGELIETDKRIWILSGSFTSNAVLDWLRKNCSTELHVEKRRYDFYRYYIDIYLYDPNRSRQSVDFQKDI
jgi:hypothetical protein